MGPVRARDRFADLLFKLRTPALCGGFLIGLATFQAEFDFGVPQFRMLFAPVLIAFAAGTGLVAARIYGGRGMAIYAALFFIAIRGALALLVGPILDEPVPHFPLFLAEALLVEAAALVIAPRLRPYAFGALAGALIGTIGFAAEYGWSHVWMPIPWEPALVGEALLPALAVAIAGGMLGGFIATAWRAPFDLETRPARPLSPAVAAIALLAVVAVVGYGLQTSPQGGVSAQVELTKVSGTGLDKTAEATVRIDPPSAAQDTDWLNVTAWQGKGLQVAPLEAVDADAGSVPELRAGADRRQLEEPGPHPEGRLDRRHADLHARGRRDPGGGGTCVQQLRAAVRLRHRDPPARAARRCAGVDEARRLRRRRRHRRGDHPAARLDPHPAQPGAVGSPRAARHRIVTGDRTPGGGQRMSAAVLVPVAHHAVWVALPFVIPVLVMTAGVLVLAIRERRRREREDAL